MTEDPLMGWPADLPVVYGDDWHRFDRFGGPSHWVIEVPGRDMAVLFYAAGEIGVGKQIGRIAVLAGKKTAEPVLVWRRLNFWHLGDGTVQFFHGGRYGVVMEFGEERPPLGGNPTRLFMRPRALDFDGRRWAELDGGAPSTSMTSFEPESVEWRGWPAKQDEPRE